MKLTHALATLAAAVMVVATTQGQTVISQWTFETNTPADLNNSMTGPSVAADVGNGTATGFHASANSDWSTPAGNGSANAFSVNTWGVNDYFQFSLSTVGFTDLWVTFSATGSATGPAEFSLQYSTTGTGGTFTSFTNYTIDDAPGFAPGTYQPSHQFSIDLSGVDALENNANVVFRLVNISTLANNGGTVATGGTSRVDDFFVSSGGPIVIPEPSTYMLIGVGLLVCAQHFRRRKG